VCVCASHVFLPGPVLFYSTVSYQIWFLSWGAAVGIVPNFGLVLLLLLLLLTKTAFCLCILVRFYLIIFFNCGFVFLHK
jgi:hypothetical protein